MDVPIMTAADAARALFCACKQCGYEWSKRSVDRPKKCPACGNRKWDEEKKT